MNTVCSCCKTRRLRWDRNSSRLFAAHFWPLKPHLDSALQCRLDAVIAVCWWKMQHHPTWQLSFTASSMHPAGRPVQGRSSWKQCPWTWTEVSELDPWTEVRRLNPWKKSKRASCSLVHPLTILCQPSRKGFIPLCFHQSPKHLYLKQLVWAETLSTHWPWYVSSEQTTALSKCQGPR